MSGDPTLVDRAIDLLGTAKRPIVVAGGGVLWSRAAATLRAFVEATGIPFYTTPISRGLIPEDHPLSHVHARSTAFREADLVFVCGTRLNYIIQHGRPPRFSADAKFIQVDIEPTEIGRTRNVDVGIVGDVDSVVRQMIDAAGKGRLHPDQHADWNRHLGEISSSKRDQQEESMSTDKVPIHPLRLCKEVRDFLPRDAYLVVDGREILTYARQSISTYEPGHRLNPGPFGTMGVGVPYAIGAKVAAPDKMVVVLHGDGSFGLNAMEMDTALRHHINILCVISNNGGWTAANNLDTDGRVLSLEPGQVKAGRDLGFTRYDLMFQAIGCHGEHVESPEDIAPALRRAGESGRPAVINVVTDPAARAQESYDLPDRTDIKYPEPNARRPVAHRSQQ
jgi:thiamine pyrophosphate-dependent acetolactate synthase large subunit-like protein